MRWNGVLSEMPKKYQYRLIIFFNEIGSKVLYPIIWGWVKTLVPFVHPKIAGIYGCEHPTKNVSIGIDPYPYTHVISP